LLDKYGYQVKVGSFVSAKQAFGAGDALWSSLTLSPTKTGLFMDIKCTYSADQIKQLEQQFKQANGIK
jgi:hypothetical protein